MKCKKLGATQRGFWPASLQQHFWCTESIWLLLKPGSSRRWSLHLTRIRGQRNNTDKAYFNPCSGIYSKRQVLLSDLVSWWISDLSDPQPVSEVSSVGQSRGQTHHSDTPWGVGGDEVCPGHNDLQHWTPVLTWSDTMTSSIRMFM